MASKELLSLLSELKSSASKPKPKHSPPKSRPTPEQLLERLLAMLSADSGDLESMPKEHLDETESWFDWALGAAETVVPMLLKWGPKLAALL